MYQIGDMVMHPGAGVCRVEDIKALNFARTGSKMYYILKPIYESKQTTIYIPTDKSKIKLRKLPSAEDIHKLINSVSTKNKLWTDNNTQRHDMFLQVLHSGKQSDIIQLIIEIHEKEKEKQLEGKKLHVADERILREAEKLIHQEFAYSLQLKPEDVAPFIMGELHLEEKSSSAS